MANEPGKLSCQLTCFAAGGLLGLVAAIILFFVVGFSSAQAIFTGILIALVLGVLGALLFCRPLPSLDEIKAQRSAEGTGSGASGSASGAGSSGAAQTAATAGASTAGGGAGGDGGGPKADAPAGAGTSDDAGDAGDGGMEGGPAPIGAAAFEDQTGIATGAPEPVGAAALADERAESTPDYDGDGVKEGTGEGKRPAALDAPRGGKADNLKEIKGIGPKLEKMLNEMGFYHFDQIANWTDEEVAWVNANLTGFKGRVTRDNWVEQAKILASGGETEFSKRVDKGDVY